MLSFSLCLASHVFVCRLKDTVIWAGGGEIDVKVGVDWAQLLRLEPILISLTGEDAREQNKKKK